MAQDVSAAILDVAESQRRIAPAARGGWDAWVAPVPAVIAKLATVGAARLDTYREDCAIGLARQLSLGVPERERVAATVERLSKLLVASELRRGPGRDRECRIAALDACREQPGARRSEQAGERHDVWRRVAER